MVLRGISELEGQGAMPSILLTCCTRRKNSAGDLAKELVKAMRMERLTCGKRKMRAQAEKVTKVAIPFMCRMMIGN